MQENSSKTVNCIVILSGILLLVMFFTPSLNLSVLNSDIISISFAKFGEAEVPIMYLLALLSFEIIISGNSLPKLSMFCAICYIIGIIAFIVYVNYGLEESAYGIVKVVPSMPFFLQILLSSVIIVALTWENTHRKRSKTI